MNSRVYPLLALLILTQLVTACGLMGNRVTASPPEAVPTDVAPTGAPATETPAPAADLLPHSLYYLASDPAGRNQVSRLEADGTTVHQVTSEPVSVQDYSVSPVDGSVAYIVNNQLVLVSADGSGRRVLVDGGVVDENNPFVNRVSHPVFSPDGLTLAYGHQGLNFYTLSTGANERAIDNQIKDMGNGMIFPTELYWPAAYSPDGSRLMITLGYYEGADAAFYSPESGALVRIQDAPGALICCELALWAANGTKVYSGNPSMGMFNAGMWEADPATGAVVTLLASNIDTSTFNMAKYPYLAPDGQLYYFFLESSNGEYSRIPLQLVRSAPDGVSGRTVIRAETFDWMNEALWSPDAGSVIVAYAPDENTYQGGRAEIVYLDGRPNVVLTPFARQMKWGP